MDEDHDSGEDQTKTRSDSTGYVLRVATPGTVLAFPFPSSGAICIGRGIGADIRVPMPDMSRRHVMVAWGNGLTVADVGSANGTILRGEKLEPEKAVPLALREPFFIADAALSVHEGSAADGPKRLVGSEAFEAALQAQLTTYAVAAKPFGVLSVEVDSDAPWTDFVVGLFGRTDVMGFVSESSLRMLLTDRTPAQLEVFEQFLVRSLARFSTSRKVTLRRCPQDGETMRALYDGARTRPRDVVSRETRRPSTPIIQGNAMRRVYSLVDEVAGTPTSILVLGETGVGKDVLARAIHERSDRFAAPLVGLNCAALPESLLESELFGYERGAFTGAVTAKPGLLESAEGGTVFLDEVGEMPLSTQAKILRVLEERKVMRLGGLKPKAVNFRLLAATNRNLQAEIAAGRFRADLFYRINGITITLPPLRERNEEIIPLANHFAERAAATLGKSVPIFAAETLACFERYNWPGNIRELRSVVERAVLLARGGAVLPEHLPDEVIQRAASRPPPREEAPTSTALPTLADDDDDENEEPALSRRSVRSAIPPPASTRGGSLKEEIERLEHQRIVDALREFGGNQTRAAESLGMTRRALIIRLERYGLPRPRKSKDA